MSAAADFIRKYPHLPPQKVSALATEHGLSISRRYVNAVRSLDRSPHRLEASRVQQLERYYAIKDDLRDFYVLVKAAFEGEPVEPESFRRFFPPTE